MTLAQSDSSQAVVNGSEILFPLSREEQLIHRATVRILRQDDKIGYYLFCTGTLIGPLRVLSAGHCFEEPAIQEEIARGQVLVEIPAENILQLPTRIPIQQAFAKADYTIDIALVVLARPLSHSASVPFAHAECDPDADVWVAGYGLDQADKTESLRLGTYKRIYGRERTEHFEGQDVQTDFIHFRFYRATGAARLCFGDSGAAIYCRTRDGRLALSAVHSKINRSLTLMDELPHNARFCESSEFIFGTPISKALNQIKIWENELLNQEDESNSPAAPWITHRGVIGE